MAGCESVGVSECLGDWVGFGVSGVKCQVSGFASTGVRSDIGIAENHRAHFHSVSAECVALEADGSNARVGARGVFALARAFLFFSLAYALCLPSRQCAESDSHGLQAVSLYKRYTNRYCHCLAAQVQLA